MRELFRQELLASGYVHAPLPIHEERSLEAENRKKPVLEKRILWDGGSGLLVSHHGLGTVTIGMHPEKADQKTIEVRFPTGRNEVAEDAFQFRSEGRAHLVFSVPSEDWTSFSRLSFFVKPECNGGHSVHFRLHLVNEGRVRVPDPYYREGQHLVNLVNHEWNQVIWEFSALPRDLVTEFSITFDADGQDTSTGPEYRFIFDDFELQKVAAPQKEHGWEVDEGRISYSYAGYHSGGRKTAVAPPAAERFRLVREDGSSALEKAAKKVSFAGQEFSVFDFSEVTAPGSYRIFSDSLSTGAFEISGKVMEEAVWKAVNFIFCERCGCPVPMKHGRCHTDVIATHQGKILSFGGGWHDAGDMSQQMLQTAEVAQELLELSARIQDDLLLSARLREEGLWGLEFTLKSRFGDGYRATSVGLGQWTNGLIGDGDDVPVRVHNQAFQNYFCAAVEAQAALLLRESDPDLAWKCLMTAKEDYRFAKARFQEKGIELPVMWEHTMNSGPSQYYAAAVWACASICMAEPDPYFEKEAKRIAKKLLACQETGTEGVPMRGFFYRDRSKRHIVHFTHQGRDHSFVQAIDALIQAFPEAEERPLWENSIRLYGEYIKEIFAFSSPYGMIPAGIHHISEADDDETFPLLHLQADFETEKEHYKKQLLSGIDLTNGYYLRMFPVWFSFRGNHAIMLGMAKAAGIAGRRLRDPELLEIARDQLYWVLGRNPFCQSLMYGEGERYAQQDANYPGEMAGELPVGIETREDEDVPYWPAGTNATYKEVWLTPAGRWLSVVAELYPEI